MKSLTFSVFFTSLLIVNCFAQETPDQHKPVMIAKSGVNLLKEPYNSSVLNPGPLVYSPNPAAEEAKWRRMKAGGAALTIVGGASFITGLAYWEKAFFHRGDRSGRVETGLVFVLCGAGALGTGIPLYIKGNRGLKKMKNQPQELSFYPTGTGGRLVYTF